MLDIIDFFIDKFKKLLNETIEPSRYFRSRPYRNAIVRFRACSIEDFEARATLAQKTGLNAFMFPAHEIPGCDLLSDSGTTSMTAEQWSQLLLGDEAYGSNEGYFQLKEQMTATFGQDWQPNSSDYENLFLFHQGRAAEHALFTILSQALQKKQFSQPSLSHHLNPKLRARIKQRLGVCKNRYLIIPSNAHFDTTEANIEINNLIPLNLPCKEHLENQDTFPFRGNLNLNDLKNLLSSETERIPLVYLTLTNNTGGGQPVSMENIKEIREITSQYNIPFFFDASRFAENAWFIQQREIGYQNKSIEQIVREMFKYADGFHISLKKDGLVNIGGSILVKPQGLFTAKYPGFLEQLTDHQILTEGHPTYGGLAGRDLKAIAEGLKTIVRQDYLDYRITQVKRFGNRLAEYGIPVLQPIGGHAVYLDMDQFFENSSDEEFKGIAFTALLLIAGHRVCELGTYAFGKYKLQEDGNYKEIAPNPRFNFVRAAVPRLSYEDQDLLAVAEYIKILFEHRDIIPGVRVTYGRNLSLRHFKSKFEFIL